MSESLSKCRIGGWMLLATLALSPLGCGQKGGTPASVPEGEKSMDTGSPVAIGAAAGKIYKDTIEALVAALQSKPEPADAKSKVTALIEGAQKQLVELGKKREALSPAERTEFDAAMTSAVMTLPDATFKTYSEIATHYRKADREVGNLIGQANVLTQYANFDLLRQQLPKEAEKFGVK